MADTNVMPRICSVEGCGKNVRVRGLCSAHYSKLLKYGSPTACVNAEHGAPMEEIRRVVADRPDGCVFWRFSRNKGGYGKVYVSKGVFRQAHAVAYEMMSGVSIPDGMVCRHKCDNGSLGCFNPRCIEIGTQADNVDDMVRKGRHRNGEVSVRLSLPQVVDIRDRIARGETQREIALEFGVTEKTINRISTGKTWRC